MHLLIRSGTLLTMDPARRVVRADLLVEDGRIVGIGPSLAPPPRCEVIEADGLVVMPGLVQAHVHLCQTLLRNRAEELELLPWLRRRVMPFEAAHDSSSMRASAELGIAELLRGGTTAIQDMGTVHHTEVLFEAAAASGIRYVGGKAMMDDGDEVPARMLERTGDSLAEADALASRFHGAEHGRLRYAFAPRFALTCTEDLLRETVHLARARGANLHTHASENRSECQAVRARTGLDNIEYLDAVGMSGGDVSLAHCVWATDREMDLLARTGTSVVHCPSANLKLGSGIARIPEMLDAGVRVALGADGAACNNNLDGFVELRLASLVHRPRVGVRAMPALRALELATIGGARALGLEAEIGSLEVGKRADLALLDPCGIHAMPTPEDLCAAVVHSLYSSDVRTVVVDGRVLMRDRELTTLDEQEVAARAIVQTRLTLERAGI